MDVDALQTENMNLKNTIKDLEDKLKKSQEKIKKYTNSAAHKEYYQAHKEEVKAKGNEYLQKLKIEDPEKLKSYWKKANDKRKLKKIENNNLI